VLAVDEHGRALSNLLVVGVSFSTPNTSPLSQEIRIRIDQ
jgi:hypothetical protein